MRGTSKATRYGLIEHNFYTSPETTTSEFFAWVFTFLRDSGMIIIIVRVSATAKTLRKSGREDGGELWIAAGVQGDASDEFNTETKIIKLIK
jgi:hypothetical protein